VLSGRLCENHEGYNPVNPAHWRMNARRCHVFAQRRAQNDP
jgi:hypothetical protein